MDQFKRLFAQFNRRQKLSIAIAGVLIIVAIVQFTRWNTERDFRPLFTNLSSEDAGAVVTRLRALNAEYRVDDSGTSVLVRSAQVADLRIQLASSGLPKTGRIGYELFDQTNFGITDFAEQVNYHRALEGELERSVMSLDAVESARVHVTFPKESVFLDSRRPAKASVLVKLRIGAGLSPQNVQAICHLAASAVDGLKPEDVSVIDMDGRLLSRPRNSLLADGTEAPDGVLDYQRSIEKDLLAKIDQTLEPLWGAGRYRAGVSVECDFSSGEQSEETFNPDSSVMLSSQRTEDVNGGRIAAGVPGTASNLPRPISTPSTANAGVSRRTENVTYQTSRVVRHTKLPLGGIRRMSVAILLDQGVRWEGSGKSQRRVLVPPTQEQLQSVRDLIAGATGLKTDRGDQLVIESLPFESTLQSSAPTGPARNPEEPRVTGIPLPRWLLDAMKKTSLPILIAVALGALIAILAMALFLLSRFRRGKAGRVYAERRELEAGKTHSALHAPGEAQGEDFSSKLEAKLAENHALQEQQEMLILDSLRLPDVNTKKVEVLRKHIGEETQKDGPSMAQILRTWLSDGET